MNKTGKLTVVLSMLSIYSTYQLYSQNMVRGIVYESDFGEKLDNVTVQIDGIDICSTTDSLGRYKITVPEKKEYIVFSKIGFDKLYVKVKHNYEINVVLAQLQKDAIEVNIGYGTQRSTEITGAVGNIGNRYDRPKSYISSTKKLKKR